MGLKKLRVALFLSLVCLSWGSMAAPLDRIKSAIGLGNLRENVCLALLETTSQLAAQKTVATVYTLNSFSSLATTLTKESINPELHNGSALIKNGQIVSGTLSRTEAASRLQGILTLIGSAGESNSDERLKYLAYSTIEDKASHNLVTKYQERLRSLQSQYRILAPANLLFQSGAWALYLTAAVQALTAGDNIASVVPILAIFFALEEWKGLKKLSPSFNSVDDTASEMNRFLSEDSDGARSALLFSDSVELREDLVNQAAGSFGPLDMQWSDLDKEFSIAVERLPFRRLVHLLGFGPAAKSIWVHSDLLIEKTSDGTREAHVLVQFTRRPPNFPRKPKEDPTLRPTNGWSEPQLQPIRVK